MKIKCPTCRQKTEWQNNPYRPFCSERCKLIDLGAWAAGNYKIEGEQISEESRIDESEDSVNTN
ncbi:MAG: DNA gyrase inhibitor YacG [Nitrospirae bacterium]|nr:DNA gyrase inhibitor YacG [Nitrospirota bacterium]